MVAVIFLRRVFQCGEHAGALGQVAVVHQVRHFQGAALAGLNLMKARNRVYALPLTQ